VALNPFRRRADPSPRVIRAAAQQVSIGDFQQAQQLALTRQAWQPRAWGYYHSVGEIHYAAQFVGNALSRIRLVGAEMEPPTNKEDAPEPIPTKDKKVQEAVDALQSERGGQSSFMRNLGINLFIPGEAWLLGYENDDGDTVWEVLSINELIIQPGDSSAYRRHTPNSPPMPLNKDALLIRVWQEDPQWSYLADSAMQTIMDECEKLIALTKADKAISRSRFAGSGLLFIPNELVPPAEQPDGSGTDVDAAENPLFKQLTEAMIEPLKNEGHPSSVVPVVLFGPSEYGEKIKYFSFEREADKASEQRRDAAITRIATAIDLPPEILLGKGDVNHWTAWQIHEETFQAHLEPLVQMICSALTQGYLQPALKRAGVKDPEKYVVWYDASKLIARPDQSETSQQLHAVGALKASSMRRANGFDEDDEPDDEEYAKRVGLLLQVPELALTGKMPDPPPAPEPPPQFGGKPPEVDEDGNPPDPADQEKPAEGKASPGNVTKGTPDSKTPGADAPPSPNGSGKQAKKGTTAAASQRGHKVPIGQQLAQLDIDLMTRLRTQMDAVLTEALTRAGNRVLNRASKDQRYSDIVTGVPKENVAGRLGPAIVASLNLNDDDLLKGSFTAFTAQAAETFKAAQRRRNELIARYLRENDERDYAEADQLDETYAERDRTARDFGVAALGVALLTLASKRLYDPLADAPTTQGEFDGVTVPGDMVRRIIESAGGTGSGLHVLSDQTLTETAGGIGTGAVARDILADNGVRTANYQWVYGPAIRSTFESHADLDGEEFSGWDDEALSVQPGDEWLGVEYYHPGDHKGCLCSVAPVFDGMLADFDTQEAITASPNGHR